VLAPGKWEVEASEVDHETAKGTLGIKEVFAL
jgi:hypothetical protein